MHKNILILFMMMLFLFPVRIQAEEDIHIEITDAGIQQTPIDDIVLPQLVPGDERIYTLQLKNESEKEQSIYLKLSAEDRLLTEKMELQVSQDKRILYKGTMLNAQDGVKLGIYRPEDADTIRITLHLPKESDNEYTMQQTAVNVDISVQTLEPAINTADDTRIAIVVTAMLISGAIIFYIKKEKGKKYEDKKTTDGVFDHRIIG